MQTVNTVGTVGAVVGVDPHKRVLSAVALDGRGGRLGQWQGGATRRGVEELLTWATGCAPGAAWAIEGSNLYGRRLALALVEAGADVRDVCPTRTAERRRRRPGRGSSRFGEAPRRLRVRWCRHGADVMQPPGTRRRRARPPARAPVAAGRPTTPPSGA